MVGKETEKLYIEKPPLTLGVQTARLTYDTDIEVMPAARKYKTVHDLLHLHNILSQICRNGWQKPVYFCELLLNIRKA